MTILSDWQLSLTVEDVLRGQGADPAVVRRRRPSLVGIAEWALAEGLPLLQPAVAALDFEVQGLRHERLNLKGGKSLSAPLLAQHLPGAQAVVALICTIGDQLEQVASQVMQTDPLLGLALDGVGTAAAELLATVAVSYFEEQARTAGLQASIPLSPGMVGWPVDPGQRHLFELFSGQDTAGVSLTENGMMVPLKSLSEVVGFGPRMAFQGRTCDYCVLKENCRYQDHYA